MHGIAGGIAAAFDTVVAATSIAHGLMVSNLILPRRFTQLTGRVPATVQGESVS